jgi:hypothetical protein
MGVLSSPKDRMQDPLSRSHIRTVRSSLELASTRRPSLDVSATAVTRCRCWSRLRTLPVRMSHTRMDPSTAAVTSVGTASEPPRATADRSPSWRGSARRFSGSIKPVTGSLTGVLASHRSAVTLWVVRSVEHDEIGLGGQRDGLSAGPGGQHGEAVVFEVGAEQVANLPLVLDDEHARGGHVSSIAAARSCARVQRPACDAVRPFSSGGR